MRRHRANNCTNPSTNPSLSSRSIKTREERCCGLSMWASVVRMALNLQLPACLPVTCFCASVSLPSTFYLHVAVMLSFLKSHSASGSISSIFVLHSVNYLCCSEKQTHKSTIWIRYKQWSCFYVCLSFYEHKLIVLSNLFEVQTSC